MSEGILHKGIHVACWHSGDAKPDAVAQVVTLSGQAAIVQSDNYTILDCKLKPPAQPCAKAQWDLATAAKHIRVQGIPLLLQNSQAICFPTQTGVIISSEPNPKVKGR